jgi:1,4-alpha-glucan branching enzyme
MTRGADLERLLAGEHSDPHSILGAHPHRKGVVVRTFRPGAESVSATSCDRVIELTALGEGVFEGVFTGATFPFTAQLTVAYPGAAPVVVPDAYSFAPTLGPLDLHLLAEGRHFELGHVLGARALVVEGVAGIAYAVWAPSARAVSVTGDFDFWNERAHPMRSLGASGVWEVFLPEAKVGDRYKVSILPAHGNPRHLNADPVAHAAEVPPRTASVVDDDVHEWRDTAWMTGRRESDPWNEPVSIYEVHLGSWRPGLDYTQLGHELADYVTDLGFTHVELMPVMAHPFAGSWGYQVTGFFAPTPRFGSPNDLREMIDVLHERGVGVLLDWVPAHFPNDPWALVRFDGTALYEHDDPRRGLHPDWGTLVFNFGRIEVRNFLVASALTWLRDFHADGLRVDAVASMLYLDYSREPGEWEPNPQGGREDLDAIAFLRLLNERVHEAEPGILSVAEESTAWPGVTRPTSHGGLGFGFKWNMGWMHDTLDYFSHDPVHRRHHHHELTFSMVYAGSENFVLPLSHDEVVHGKRSLLQKMPGDRWQQLANLRALYGYMWAHPGKQLLFMGGEFAQEREWNHDRPLDWDLLGRPEHVGVQRLVRDLNTVYRSEPALWEADYDSGGFTWLVDNDADHSVFAFARSSRDRSRTVVCVANLTPVPRHGYRLGLPRQGRWREVLNTDSQHYGGSDVGNLGGVVAGAVPAHRQQWSATVALPPLGVVWLVPDE